jgi:alpha-galactosidase
MLQVCNYGHVNGGMTLNEYRSHFSVWAMFASPLILSFDVRSIATTHPDCLAMVMTPHVIALNQDPLGAAARLVYQVGSTSMDITTQVFARALSDGNIAVLLFNRAKVDATLGVSFAQLGIPPSSTLTALDYWNALAPLGRYTANFTAVVPSHGVVLAKLVL